MLNQTHEEFELIVDNFLANLYESYLIITNE